MQLWFWCTAVLVPAGILGSLCLKFQKQNSSNLTILTEMIQKQGVQNSRNLNLLSGMMERQIQMNQTLTNLLLSKDPMTFQGLQAVTNLNQNPFDQVAEAVNPLDDRSQALALAEQYKRHGLDPNGAFAQDEEPIDFATEFGV